MGYTTNDGMVRVDRFKPGGKWYDTWEVNMSGYYNLDAGKSEVTGETLPPTWLAVERAILDALERSVGVGRTDCRERAVAQFRKWNWVCLEPYHAQAYPIMIVHQQMWQDWRKAENDREYHQKLKEAVI